MALTVQSIANDVSLDVRQALLATGSDLTILTGFIDRIHKDCMHSSVYSYLNNTNDSVTTVVGTASYQLLNANIRRINSVYDRTRDRMLFPIEMATAPVGQLEKQTTSPGQVSSSQTKFGPTPFSALSLQSGQPEYYRHRPPNVGVGPNDILVLYPTPKQILTLEVSEQYQVITLVNPSDTLLIPEDGRDIVVAGVDYLANIYLKRVEEAQAWAQLYMQLKTGATLI